MRACICGPMRGRPEFNHPAFHEAARLLRAGGHEVFCPAEQDDRAGAVVAGLAGDVGELAGTGFDLRAQFGASLAWIAGTAEAVVLLPGWEGSAGARAEAAVALALGLPVWDLDGFLLAGERADRIAAVPGGGR